MQFKVQELTVNLLGGRVSLSLQGEGLTFINVSLPLPTPESSGQGQLEQRVYEEARRLLAAALDSLNEDHRDQDTDLKAHLAQGIAQIEGETSDADQEAQPWDEHHTNDADQDEHSWDEHHRREFRGEE